MMTPGLRVSSGVKHSGGTLPNCAGVQAAGWGHRSGGARRCCTNTVAVEKCSGCRVEGVGMAAAGRISQARTRRARGEKRPRGSRRPGR